MKYNRLLMIILSLTLLLGTAFAATSENSVESKVADIDADSMDSCVAKLQENFPNIGEPRLRTACAERFNQAESDMLRKRVTTAREALTVQQQERLQKISIAREQMRKIAANKELLDLPQDSLKEAARLTRGELKHLSEVTPEKIREKIMERTELKERVEKVREVAAEKKQKLKNQIANKYEKIAQEEGQFEKAKENLEQLKEEIEKCSEDNSEECEQLRNQVKTRSKEYMMKHLEIVIDRLNVLKDKLESAENIDQETLDEKLAQINSLISEAQDLKTQIEAFTDETTPEQYREAAQSLKEIWSKIKTSMYMNTVHLMHQKVGLVIVRSSHMEERLEKYLLRLEENGVDISAADSEIEEFSTLVSEAKNLYDEGMELFKQAQGSKSSDLFKQANEKFQDAQNKLKDAQMKFVDIKKILRENNIEYDEDELETEEEEEEEIEEESETDMEDESEEAESDDEQEQNEETQEDNDTEDEQEDDGTENEAGQNDSEEDESEDNEDENDESGDDSNDQSGNDDAGNNEDNSTSG